MAEKIYEAEGIPDNFNCLLVLHSVLNSVVEMPDSGVPFVFKFSDWKPYLPGSQLVSSIEGDTKHFLTLERQSELNRQHAYYCRNADIALPARVDPTDDNKEDLAFWATYFWPDHLHLPGM